jgi:nitrogen fixation NifU-like protein
MSEIEALYQEVILDHYKRPRNRGRLPAPARTAEGYNPLCGDRVFVSLALEGEVISAIRVEAEGCAIAVASGSIMSEALKGRTIADAEALFEELHEVVLGRSAGLRDGPKLGKLAAFAGVAQFPVRVKCAMLPWHAFRAALANAGEPVTTE